MLFVAKYCGALLAPQTHCEVRSNPTYEVRVVFGCNYSSHFERNTNNSASRHRNRCGVPRRQEHRERSGGDLGGRLRVLHHARGCEAEVGKRFGPCANADSDGIHQRLFGQQGYRVFAADQHNRAIQFASEATKSATGHGVHADISKVRRRILSTDFKSQRFSLVWKIPRNTDSTSRRRHRLFPVLLPDRHEWCRCCSTRFVEFVCLLAETAFTVRRPLVSKRYGYTVRQYHRQPRRLVSLSSAVSGFQTTAYVYSAERPVVLRRGDGAREHAGEE